MNAWPAFFLGMTVGAVLTPLLIGLALALIERHDKRMSERRGEPDDEILSRDAIMKGRKS